MRSLALTLLALLFALPASSSVTNFDHGDWGSLLERHVQWIRDGHASAVNYRGFAEDRAALRSYLDRLSAVPIDTYRGWTLPQRQAFLINAYNAFTVELILSEYPQLESIRDLGGWFRSPWSLRFFRLLGKQRSLDEVEHELLRGADDFAEPRIHFAVNCASIGCPALRPEAYRGEQLDAQLADQTHRFLSDRQRNWVEGDTLWVSKLFDWYAEDFTGADGTLSAPMRFLAAHADALGDDAEQRAAIRAGTLRLRFAEYDWRLNDRARHATE